MWPSVWGDWWQHSRNDLRPITKQQIPQVHTNTPHTEVDEHLEGSKRGMRGEWERFAMDKGHVEENTDPDLVKEKHKMFQVDMTCIQKQKKMKIMFFPTDIIITDEVCACSPHFCTKCLCKRTGWSLARGLFIQMCACGHTHFRATLLRYLLPLHTELQINGSQVILTGFAIWIQNDYNYSSSVKMRFCSLIFTDY